MRPSYYLNSYLENMYDNSDDYTGGNWTHTNITITENSILGPDGIDFADEIKVGLSGSVLNMWQYIEGINQGDSILLDGFFKAGELDAPVLLFQGAYFHPVGAGNYPQVEFDLTNETMTVTDNVNHFDYGMEHVRDDWYYCWASAPVLVSVDSAQVGQIRFDKTTSIDTYDTMYAYRQGLRRSEVAIPSVFTDSGEFLIGVSATVGLYPEYDYTEADKKIENRFRSKTGKEYVYKFGDYGVRKFGVKFVNDDDKRAVNSMWLNNTDLTMTDKFGFDVFSCHLTNKAKPIGKMMVTYTDMHQGKIELEGY